MKLEINLHQLRVIFLFVQLLYLSSLSVSYLNAGFEFYICSMDLAQESRYLQGR